MVKDLFFRISRIVSYEIDWKGLKFLIRRLRRLKEKKRMLFILCNFVVRFFFW